MDWKKVRDTLSAPLEWTADQLKARPKGFLALFAVANAVSFILGARWF